MSEWNSEQYLKFKKERTQPSIDLANAIKINNPINIIDIGCVQGNSTAVLKKLFPNAHTIGADFSPNMIEKAKTDYPDIEFMLFDATKDFEKIEDKFDIVFSNACIQWVPNHKKLLSDMMCILKPNGVLAVQVPMNFEEPIHKIIAEVITRKEWAEKIGAGRQFHTLKESEYFDILSDISSDFTMWKTIYMHRMPSHQSIIEWYKSTGMKEYLAVLSDEDKIKFEQAVFSEVEKYYSVQKNGEIIFRFPRLFFTAVK